MSRRVHSIVAQRDERLKEEQEWTRSRYEYGATSTFTRFGFVSMAAVLLMLVWLSLSRLAATGQQDEMATASDSSLAVINPANVLKAEGSGADQSGSGAGVAPLSVIARAVTPEAESIPSSAANASGGKPLKIMQLAQAVQESSPTQRSLAIVADSNAAISGASGSKTTVKDLLFTQQDASQNGKRSVAQLIKFATPTATPSPTATATPTEENIPQDVPQVKLIPMLPIPSATSTGTPTNTPTMTPTPLPLEPGTLWSTFIPGPPSETDHFWISRPFLPSARNQLASPNYQFGSTAYGRYRIHHGLDLSNPAGTPILAAVTGEVIHAGVDDPVLLAPFTNFYGKSVVIRLDRRLPVAGGELDVFLLYGHMSEVTVTVGQRVGPGDVVGTIGMTGIAIGPHLHIEVRVGSNTYDKSVNPYLWLQPREGTGVVAVRLLTSDGRTWPGGRVSLLGLGEGGSVTYSRQIDIYLNGEPLSPDPLFGENGALGSVPAGRYLLVTTVNGERIRKEISVRAGETSFVEMRTQQ